MAKKTQPPETETVSARKAENAPAPDQTYEIAKLREHAYQLFGENIGPHVLDGALDGRTEPMTVSEADRAVRDWLARPVAGPAGPRKKKGGR